MAMLILGLLLFLGVHSTRVFADSWRARQIQRLGPMGWKALYSVLSLAGFALLVILLDLGERNVVGFGYFNF